MDGELKVILIKFFIMVFLVILFVAILTVYLPPFLDYLLHGNSAYGQTTNVPTPPITSSTSTLPNPNTQYLPQKAYIQVFPPDGISVTPIQSQTSSSPIDPNSLVSSAVASAAAYFLAKKRADSNKTDLEEKRKEDLLDLLRTKQQTQELAKYTFSIDPQKAEALENADKIKLCNLEADVNKTSEKVAKS